MKKVLFSTTWGPFQEQYFNTSPIDVMNQRFSRGCDIFSLNAHLHMNWAHLIAQNIELPSLFLEYPGKEDFLAEVEKGYDYVAISAFHNQVDDLVDMCRAVRDHAPRSKIVLGGFGAVGLEATTPKKELKSLCDHLCHGEGIRFFRDILGEDPDRPMFHSHLPKWGYSLPMLNQHPRGNTPVVVGSVGCPNGCDFCGTTEMFQQRRIELMSPEQVHREFRRAWRENPLSLQGVLLEEDTFQNVDYIRELGRLLREDTEFGLGYYNFYCLASNRSMSQWTFEEMALTGCSTVFVGVESKFAEDEGYGKTEGMSNHEMFEGLHRVGILTTGAWMVGFDFQTRENIEEDLQEFVSLAPAMQQLTRVCPFPATPMWRQLRKEGRIRKDFKWQEVSFYGGGGMISDNFYDHEIVEIIERGYKLLYETHGASIARIMRINLLGYEYCMENRSRNQYLEDRAFYHRRLVYSFFPLLKALEIYAPNNRVRKTMKDLHRMYVRLFGEPTKFQKGMEKALTLVSGATKVMDLIHPRDNVLVEEAFKKYLYDKPAPSYPECPYRIEYPHRTRTFDLNLVARENLCRALSAAEQLSGLPGRLRKGQEEEDMPPGMFGIFL
ncbi:B12-binding domain-containing radical SAM protein [Thermodesulfobacteriota bacterium]